MINPQDSEIEAAALVQMRMGKEFNALMVMVATNADNSRRSAISRGAAENREENCGRAQVWLELQDFLAGAATRWEQIEKRRKEKQKEGTPTPPVTTYHDPYEEGFN